MTVVTSTRNALAASLLLIFCCSAAISQENGLAGEWTFVTTGFDSLRGGTSYISVSIEESNGQLQAYAYNGPAPLRVNGNEFEMDLDWHSGFDLEHLATFKGHLKDDGTIEGEMSNNGENNFLGRPMRNGQFTATRAKSTSYLESLPTWKASPVLPSISAVCGIGLSGSVPFEKFDLR